MQPAFAGGFLYAAFARQGQCHGDKGIEQPDHGGGTHQPDTPAVDALPFRQVQGEVQFVEERHQVFRVQGDFPPLALADNLAGDRVHEGVIVIQLITLPGLRVFPGIHPDFRVMAGLGFQAKEAGTHPGIGVFHMANQLQHG